MSIKFENTSQIPLALAVFLASDSYVKSEDAQTISATTLLKPIKQIILPSRIPQGEALPNLGDFVASRIGTAVHDAIERSWLTNHKTAMQALGIPLKTIEKIIVNPTDADDLTDRIPIYLEQRVERKVGDWTITGQFDFVSEGRVQDFKTTSTYTYTKQTSSKKYVEQGSIYRWLNEKIITDDIMAIHYIFTDWKRMQTYEKNYPSNRITTQFFDLMPVNDTDRMIRSKIALIEQYLNADESEMPLCTDEELWRTEPKYKYYKNGDINAARSTKNFDTLQEAVLFKTTSGGDSGAIKEVPGTVTACKYCPAFVLCTQKDNLILNGELLLEG
jgi:hypothetical protein